MKIVSDTNIIIDHLRRVPQATKLFMDIQQGNFEGLISTITILELMAAPKMTEERFNAVRELLDIFDVIPVDGRVASAAGMYLARYRASHGLEPMDAIIAATALTNDAALFTLNVRHFRFIEGLVVINPYVDCD